MNPEKLFEYLEMLFDKNSNWESVKNTHKKNHHFMMSRFLAIQFPVNSNEFNRMGVDPTSVADYWHYQLGKNYTKLPGWMYTKTKKVAAKDKSIFVPSKEVKEFWMKINESNLQDYEQMMTFFATDFLSELQNLELQMKFMS